MPSGSAWQLQGGGGTVTTRPRALATPGPVAPRSSHLVRTVCPGAAARAARHAAAAAPTHPPGALRAPPASIAGQPFASPRPSPSSCSPSSQPPVWTSTSSRWVWLSAVVGRLCSGWVCWHRPVWPSAPTRQRAQAPLACCTRLAICSLSVAHSHMLCCHVGWGTLPRLPCLARLAPRRNSWRQLTTGCQRTAHCGRGQGGITGRDHACQPRRVLLPVLSQAFRALGAALVQTPILGPAPLTVKTLVCPLL